MGATTLIFPAKSFDVYAGAQNDAQLRSLFENSFKVAFHYYSRTPGKNLTAASAQQLSNLGFWIGVVWEAAGSDPDNFNAVQGASDAQAAVAQALAVGQPQGTGIAFAVDFDPSPEQITENILPYFIAADEVVRAAGFQIGAYGCGAVLLALHEATAIDYDWLAGALGWSGSREYVSPFDPDGKPAISQGLETLAEGLNIDPDVVYHEAAGLFQVVV